MDDLFTIQIPTQKIYKDRAIEIATFLGGPLVAGYLIAENFNAFDERDKSKKTWAYSIIATILVFGGLFLVPDTVNIPHYVIPAAYAGIAHFLVKHFQGQKISAHVNAGGQLFNWWRTIAISLVGLVNMLMLVFSFAFLYDTLLNP